MRKVLAAFALFLCFFSSACSSFNLDKGVENKSSVSKDNDGKSALIDKKAESSDNTSSLASVKDSFTGELAVSVYYASMSEDPDGLAPEVTYPTSFKIAGTTREEAAKKALELLISGPSEENKAKGFYTTIPKDTKVNFIKIEDGKIIADFSKSLNSGGGSCDMQQRRSQIENTLRSVFPDDKEIIISVEGNSEQALQP